MPKAILNGLMQVPEDRTAASERTAGCNRRKERKGKGAWEIRFIIHVSFSVFRNTAAQLTGGLAPLADGEIFRLAAGGNDRKGDGGK